MWLLKLIPGATALAGSLGGLLLKAYTARLDSQNSRDAKLAELAAKEIALDQRQAELDNAAKQQIRGRWWEPENLAFYLIAFPYFFKAITIDNTLRSVIGSQLFTPPLSGDTAKALMMIMVFWFGKRAIGDAVTKLAGLFKRT